MILTQCAVCATDLGLTLGKKCGRCSTRYCGPECQVQHWKEGGHDQLCKPIKKAGGAEQYYANKNYAEAVAVAAEACAEDTKGQTCFICTQALHWKTKEGLVRGCSCRGTAGLAHVSCLAEQAKILVAEALENNWDNSRFLPRWHQWVTCSLCEQQYHGFVRCALGWACWKTYVGRPDRDEVRSMAMGLLGNGLYEVGQNEGALSVQEAELAFLRCLGAPANAMLCVQTNLANTYVALGRKEQALCLQREVYYGRSRLDGEEHRSTLRAATNYATSLVVLNRCEEAKSVLRKTMPVARRVLGQNDELMLKTRSVHAEAFYRDPNATLDDLREAVTTIEDLERIARRVLGGAHPTTAGIGRDLQNSRAALAAHQGTPPGNERP